jgi:hypothetical protein
MLLHACFELSHQLVVATVCQVALDPLLEADQPKLLEAAYLDLREALIGQLGQWRPPPQGQRVPQPALVLRALEPGEIELVRLHPQQVARRRRQQALFTEQLPKLRDVQLKRLPRRLGRRFLPERVDQPSAGHDPIGLQQ